MADSTEIIRDSPVSFETAVAYALQPAMRRLIIVYVAGLLILPTGLGMFGEMDDLAELIGSIIGLALILVGATLLFGGLIGAAFKLVTDANRLANEG